MTWKRAARAAGYVITALAFFYLFKTASKLDLRGVYTSARAAWGWLGLFIAFDMALFILLALGWQLLLKAFLKPAFDIPFREVFGIYTRSNILKYLPGNVLGLVGRNYLLNRRGLSHRGIALASLTESILLCLCAALVSWLCLFPGGEAAAWIKAGLAAPAVAATAGSKKLRRFFLVLTIDAAIFAGLGLIMFGILTLVLKIPAGLPLAATVTGAFALSWACGFVTPGAPGGLGVRETVLLMTLSPHLPGGPLMIAIVLQRAVSILGDVLVLAFNPLLARRPPALK